MCTPPNPATINAVPQAGGVNSAQAPNTMNAAPITGTMRTEYVPAVTTPVP